MRIISGDECGLLKEVVPEYTRPLDIENNDNNSPDFQIAESGIRHINLSMSGGGAVQTRAKGVHSMTFTSPIDGDSNISDGFSFSTLHIDGSVEVWNASVSQDNLPNGSGKKRQKEYTYTKVKTVQNVFMEQNQSQKSVADDAKYRFQKPVAIRSLSSDRLTCCSSSGQITILKNSTENIEIVSQYDTIKNPNVNGGSSNKRKIDDRKKNDRAVVVSAFDQSYSGRAAYGGRDRETVLIDIESGKQIWKAKNLPPDPQTLLQQPIWAKAIQFLSDDSIPNLHSQNKSGGISSSSVDDNILLVGTAYKQIKVYDIRCQRRPVLHSLDESKGGFLKYAITSLCQLDSSTSPYQIVAGDTAGYIHTLDLRSLQNSKTPVGRFVGPAGSVRQIELCPSNKNVIACAGLDRMLRTWDVKSRKCLDKIYLKQRLNCMLFCADSVCKSDQLEVTDGDFSASVDAETYDFDNDENLDEDDVQDYEDSDDDANNNEANNTPSSSQSSEESSSHSEDDELDSDSDSESSVESSGRKPSKSRRV